MVDFTYWINGYPLGSATQKRGIWLLDATEYAPALSPRMSVIEVPGVHYQVPMWDTPLSAITVSMRIRLKGDSPTDLANLWDTLTGLVGLARYDNIMLRRERGGAYQQAEAQLLSSDTPDFRNVRDTMDVTLVFSCPMGAWRSESEIEETLSIGTAVSQVAMASTMPVVDALVLATGPITVLQVTDNITDTGIQWGGGSQTVPSGQWLLVSLSSMQAWIKTTNDWNLSGIAASSSLTFLRRRPLTLGSQRAGTTATVTSSVTTSVTGGGTSVKLRARSATV